MAKRRKRDDRKNEKAKVTEKKVKKEIVQSTQQNIPVSDFYNGMIVDDKGDFTCVMEVLASPFGMKKNDEKNRIFMNYQRFLELAPTNLHIKSVSILANLADQIKDISNIIESKEDRECEEMRREYLAHLVQAEDTTITSRYFICFGYEGNISKNSPNYKENVYQWMREKANSLAEILQSCGDRVIPFDPYNPNLHTAEILYTLYNRSTSKKLSMKDRISLLMDKYIHAEPEKFSEGEVPYIPPLEYLAPSEMKFNDPNIVKCDDTYYRFMYVPASKFPSTAYCGWPTMINRALEVGVDIDVFYEKKDPTLKTMKLSQSIARQIVSMNDSGDKVTSATYENKEKLQGALYLQEGISSGCSFFNVSILFTATGGSIQEVESKCERLMNYATQSGTKLALIKYQPEDAFKSVMMQPKLERSLVSKTARNCLTDGAATTYLFTSFQMVCKDGTYIADDLSTSSPVIYDFFDNNLANNPHAFVTGESGAGKSVAIKLIAMRARVKKQKVFVVVPEKESEFKRISNEFNGQFISLSPGSKARLNIFDISVPDADAIKFAKETEGIDLEASSWLSQKIQVLLAFFTILSKKDFGGLEQQEVLNDAIMRTYARFGITEDNNSVFENSGAHVLKRFPIISDLITTLKETNNSIAKSFATILRIFENGSYSFLNGQTNVDITNDFFVIGLENNTSQALGLATFAATEYIWGKIKESKDVKKSLIMDEWWKMAYNPIAAERTMEIARLARSYNCSLIIATQQMKDVMALENGKYGEAVLNSCATKIIFHLQTKDLKEISNLIQLTEGEKAAIVNFRAGQALLLNSVARMRIQFSPSEKERDLTFTDAQTLARLARKQKEKQRKEAERKRKLEEEARKKAEAKTVTVIQKKPVQVDIQKLNPSRNALNTVRIVPVHNAEKNSNSVQKKVTIISGKKSNSLKNITIVNPVRKTNVQKKNDNVQQQNQTFQKNIVTVLPKQNTENQKTITVIHVRKDTASSNEDKKAVQSVPLQNASAVQKQEKKATTVKPISVNNPAVNSNKFGTAVPKPNISFVEHIDGLPEKKDTKQTTAKQTNVSSNPQKNRNISQQSSGVVKDSYNDAFLPKTKNRTHSRRK